MAHNIVIAGCGNIGLKLALALSPSHRVFGLKRDITHLPSEITGISVDVTDPLSLEDKLPSSVDYLVYCLTAGSFNDETYRQIYVEGLRNTINELKRTALTPKRIFFVSSSSVYPQDDDQWVNEESPVKPSRFSGIRLLEAEQVAHTSPFAATSIRFSGIYGGHRTRLLEQVKSGQANGQSTAYTNRIHEDDCVQILRHLIEQDINGATVADCYLASDCEPVRMNDLVSWVSEELGIHSAKRDAADGSLNSQHNTPGKAQRRAGSKKCSNKRLLESGYKFKYPTFREGYREMIKVITHKGAD